MTQLPPTHPQAWGLTAIWDKKPPTQEPGGSSEARNSGWERSRSGMSQRASSMWVSMEKKKELPAQAEHLWAGCCSEAMFPALEG